MALEEADLNEIDALLADERTTDEERTQLLELKAQAEDVGLQDWASAAPVPGEDRPVAPGSLGIKSVIGQELPPEPELKMDKRFDLMPQALSIQPATTDPEGDKAAEAKWVVGDPKAKDAVYAYEPPVATVREQLLQNPSFLRAIYPEYPPTLEEITSMTPGSGVYRDAANYMWRQTANKAAEAGKTVIRYSQAPWLQSDQSWQDQLQLKLGGAAQPAGQMGAAFIMGLDNTGLFGAGRAAQETASPETNLHAGANADTMGLDENVPQSTAYINSANIEENPGPYMFGQGVAMLSPWGAANQLYRRVAQAGQAGVRGAGAVASRLGALAPRIAASGAGRVASKVAAAGGKAATSGAVAGVAGGVTQGVQEGVDMAAQTAQTGEPPTEDRLAEASERVKGAGQFSGAVGAGGSVLQQLGAYGADKMRWTERHEALIGRSEPNMDWRLRSVVTGPRLKGSIAEEVKQARKGGFQPGDPIVKEIAPKIRAKADERVKGAINEAGAEDAEHFATPEGQERLAMPKVMDRSLGILRDKHQASETTGKLVPVDESHVAARKVFNRRVERVSLEPVDGALELPLDEAEAFLEPQLLNPLRPKKAPAATGQSSGAREVDLEAPPAEEGEQDMFESLRARGVKSVYVVPKTYDARRSGSVIRGLQKAGEAESPQQEDFKAMQKAALEDRDARSAGGKRGGWSEVKQRQNERIKKEKAVEKSVAPGDDNSVRAVARHGKSRSGEIIDVEHMREVADQAGVREQLDKLRHLDDALETQSRASFIGSPGNKDKRFLTAAEMRLFPVLKSLEGPLGPIHGGARHGRWTQLGQGEDAAKRWDGDTSKRAKYERTRAKILKDKRDQREREEERYK